MHLRIKHIRSLLVACSILVLIVIGSTVAYFTSRDEATNRFVSSKFDLILTETKWNPQAGRNVIPGDELEKNPQITNNDKTEGYVFLRVTVPGDIQRVDNDNGTAGVVTSTSAPVPMYKFMVKNGSSYDVDGTFTSAQVVSSHWQLVGAPTFDAAKKQFVYVYAYATPGTLTVLREGQTTDPLFDKLQLWNFDENYDSTKDHSVRVEALGIQANLPGYTPNQIEDIWSLLNGGGGG